MRALQKKIRTFWIKAVSNFKTPHVITREIIDNSRVVQNISPALPQPHAHLFTLLYLSGTGSQTHIVLHPMAHPSHYLVFIRNHKLNMSKSGPPTTTAPSSQSMVSTSFHELGSTTPEPSYLFHRSHNPHLIHLVHSKFCWLSIQNIPTTSYPFTGTTL